MFMLRGFEFTHEAVREWEERFVPLLAEHIRRKRMGQVGCRWYVDETYIKVKGNWCYQTTPMRVPKLDVFRKTARVNHKRSFGLRI